MSSPLIYRLSLCRATRPATCHVLHAARLGQPIGRFSKALDEGSGITVLGRTERSRLAIGRAGLSPIARGFLRLALRRTEVSQADHRAQRVRMCLSKRLLPDGEDFAVEELGFVLSIHPRKER